ncbi:MAG TPA: glycosyltransferase family 1 protein [Solirubrobacteraceae bacterium]|jgi:glycosyltransferase involved in cell wall biosynthesis|nr:glycosyltransferase family 1 protein [Solirubrobacteraceae bacterium]
MTSHPSRTLTIGIDARAAVEVAAGRGRFVREVLSALSRRDDDVRYLCYTRTRWEQRLDRRFEWRLLGAADPRWHILAARAANRECDVFLSTNSYLTTWMLRVPAVLVIYDMVAFDRAYRPNGRSAAIERLTLAPAVRRSRSFIAISQATATDFERRFPRSAGRVTVAPLGVATQLDGELGAAEQARLPEPGFILAVGTLEPRKNLPRLVAAYRLLDEHLQREHPLLVVGELGWRADATLAALQSLTERCVMLGRVSDPVLAELYRRCAVFCYPSLYEGFGLPVLEAMAAGAAVLTSNVSSLPEVGGDAVEYADPYDPAAIASALRGLLESPERRATLGAAARQRAAKFDWGATAEIIIKVLKRSASE